MKKKETDATDAKSIARKRILAVTGIAGYVFLLVTLFWFVGKPMLSLVSDSTGYREWVAGRGAVGKLAFIGMMAFQVVVAIIPGEPFEIAAGFAFGGVTGTLLCLFGILVGSTVVFLIVKLVGRRAAELFFSSEKIDSLLLIKGSSRLRSTIFVLFLIPGTPKDILTYFGGLTGIKLFEWLLITTLARIPSVVTSTFGGDAIGLKKYGAAAAIFALTALFSVIGMICYKKICDRRDGRAEE